MERSQRRGRFPPDEIKQNTIVQAGCDWGTAPKRWSRRAPVDRLARSSSQNACELIFLAVARGGIESPTFPLFKPRRGYQ